MIDKCQNCGATLTGIVCAYCGARNEVDLKKRYDVHTSTERVCPNCEIFLDTIMIDKEKALYIEQCKHCQGIFLDFGELEALMEREIVKSEKKEITILQEVINNPRVREKKVKYKKCPQCRKMMARFNYKQRSGVIIDRCGSCGYWLDSGELRQIMEWVKLSGISDFSPKPLPEDTHTITSYQHPRMFTTRYDYRADLEHDIFSSIIDALVGGLYGFKR